MDNFTGKLVLVGFGSIGQAVLPLLLRDLDVAPGNVTIIKTCADRSGIANALGVGVIAEALHEHNF